MCRLVGGGRGRADFDFAELDGARDGVDGAIDKEGAISVGEVFGEVGCPLVAGDHADGWVVAVVFLGPGGEMRTDAII